MSTDRVESLMELCREAVRLHGADWVQVKAHVEERLRALPLDERAELDREVRRVNAEPTPSASSPGGSGSGCH